MCAKGQCDWQLGSRGAEDVSAKWGTTTSFVTPGVRGLNKKLWAKNPLHLSFFIISTSTKCMHSAIYTYVLHLRGENQLGMPVLCLEHSVNALITNFSRNSCTKFGEIVMSKRHLPFSINSCKPGNVQQGASNVDAKCFSHSYLYEQYCKNRCLWTWIQGGNIPYENIMYIT